MSFLWYKLWHFQGKLPSHCVFQSQYSYEATGNSTKKCFTTLLPSMDREQAVFEQLTLTDFNKWSSIILKTFNNYTIAVTNNNDKISILWEWCCCLHCIFFELIQQAVLVNFILSLNIFKISRISFWYVSTSL